MDNQAKDLKLKKKNRTRLSETRKEKSSKKELEK